MRLLASTYTPKDLNFKGFSFYADFRPEVNEWGKRGEVRCRTILDLRNLNQSGDVGAAPADGVAGEKVKEEREGGDGDNDVTVSGGGGGSGDSGGGGEQVLSFDWHGERAGQTYSTACTTRSIDNFCWWRHIEESCYAPS